MICTLTSTSFHLFLDISLCPALSPSKVTHFSHSHHHRFLKHVHIIATYFFVPLLLSSIPNHCLNSTGLLIP